MIAILYGLLWSRHTDAHYTHLINQELRLTGAINSTNTYMMELHFQPRLAESKTHVLISSAVVSHLEES